MSTSTTIIVPCNHCSQEVILEGQLERTAHHSYRVHVETSHSLLVVVRAMLFNLEANNQ